MSIYLPNIGDPCRDAEYFIRDMLTRFEQMWSAAGNPGQFVDGSVRTPSIHGQDVEAQKWKYVHLVRGQRYRIIDALARIIWNGLNGGFNGEIYPSYQCFLKEIAGCTYPQLVYESSNDFCNRNNLTLIKKALPDADIIHIFLTESRQWMEEIKRYIESFLQVRNGYGWSSGVLISRKATVSRDITVSLQNYETTVARVPAKQLYDAIKECWNEACASGGEVVSTTGIYDYSGALSGDSYITINAISYSLQNNTATIRVTAIVKTSDTFSIVFSPLKFAGAEPPKYVKIINPTRSDVSAKNIDTYIYPMKPSLFGNLPSSYDYSWTYKAYPVEGTIEVESDVAGFRVLKNTTKQTTQDNYSETVPHEVQNGVPVTTVFKYKTPLIMTEPESGKYCQFLINPIPQVTFTRTVMNTFEFGNKNFPTIPIIHPTGPQFFDFTN